MVTCGFCIGTSLKYFKLALYENFASGKFFLKLDRRATGQELIIFEADTYVLRARPLPNKNALKSSLSLQKNLNFLQYI